MMGGNSSKDVNDLAKPVFSELPESYTLSEEQIKFYNDKGYLVIKELIDFASLYSYKQRFTQICNGLVPKGGITIVKEPSIVSKQLKPESYVNKIQDILFDDIFITYGNHPRMTHIVSQMIGDDITAVNSMFINKPPGTGRHPSHQDLFYFPFRPAEKIIGAWTAVDHVNIDNGCLYVVPCSHKENVLHPHGILPDSNHLYHGLLNEDILAPVDKRIQLEMSPGDTVFFHPYLIHGSGPNVSKNYRKAITFHFANSGCHYIDVKNTVQENAANDLEKEALRRGYQITFADIMRYRARQIKGVRSNL